MVSLEIVVEILPIHSVTNALKIVYLCSVLTKLGSTVLHNSSSDNIYKCVLQCFAFTKLKV